MLTRTLDRDASRRDRRLRPESHLAERRAARDRELEQHEIDARHLLGDGVLDLQAGIGFDEHVGRRDGAAGRRRGARLRRPHAVRGLLEGVEVDQELEGAEPEEARRRGHAHGVAEDPFAQPLGKPGGGRALDQLLVAALEGAVALSEVAHRTGAVADDLHLDVARAADQPLDVEAAVAERGERFGAAARVGLLHLLGALDDAHAAPSPAGDRLQHHRAAGAERGEEPQRLVERHRGVDTLEHRHATVARRRPGPRLVAVELERLWPRPDEDEARFGAAPRERGALGQKAVAGMHGVAAGHACRFDDLLGVEIGLRSGADEGARFVGAAHVERARVVLRVDGDRAQAGLGRGAHDAHRDLAAVRHQETVQAHRRCARAARAGSSGEQG